MGEMGGVAKKGGGQKINATKLFVLLRRRRRQRMLVTASSEMKSLQIYPHSLPPRLRN